MIFNLILTYTYRIDFFLDKIVLAAVECSTKANFVVLLTFCVIVSIIKPEPFS